VSCVSASHNWVTLLRCRACVEGQLIEVNKRVRSDPKVITAPAGPVFCISLPPRQCVLSTPSGPKICMYVRVIVRVRSCARASVAVAILAAGEDGAQPSWPAQRAAPMVSRWWCHLTMCRALGCAMSGRLQPGTEGFLAVIMPWTDTSVPEITNAADRPPPDKDLVERDAFQAARRSR
jgi:hypothetical protein